MTNLRSSTRSALSVCSGVILSCILSACTQRASIQLITLPPNADADLLITGEPASSDLPKAGVEVRNTGEWIADIKITEAETWGTLPAPRDLSPPLPLPPNGTWTLTIDTGALLHFHNNAPDRAAHLQLFTPSWTTLRLTVYPDGRNSPARQDIMNEPGADGLYRQPPARPMPPTEH
jgi:hypothetical protein